MISKEELKEIRDALSLSDDMDTSITRVTDDETIHNWMHQLVKTIDKMKEGKMTNFERG